MLVKSPFSQKPKAACVGLWVCEAGPELSTRGLIVCAAFVEGLSFLSCIGQASVSESEASGTLAAPCPRCKACGKKHWEAPVRLQSLRGLWACVRSENGTSVGPKS